MRICINDHKKLNNDMLDKLIQEFKNNNENQCLAF